MLTLTAVLLALIVLYWVFSVRERDLPQTAPPVPWQHLEGRKAAIYENLRDLQFEYRVGKLSDDDYQRTKRELQGELAAVMLEIDSMKGKAPATAVAAPAAKPDGRTCPHCGARFEKTLKFCGECGKPMAGANA